MKQFSFQTKFDLEDTIFFISHTTTRIIEAKVIEILFFIEKGHTKIYYKTEPYGMVVESESYSSREEILNKL